MSKHDTPKKTVRQEWAEFSHDIQQDVNDTLAKLQLEIEMGNATLIDLYENNPEECGEFAAGIIDYLDNTWGYVGDRFMVFGKWLEPAIATDQRGILTQLQEKEAFRPAVSNGFTVHIPEHREDAAPIIGMSFNLGNCSISSSSIQGHFELLAFADPKDISLHYMRPGEDDLVSSKKGEVKRSIRQADALLDLYTRHKSSSFYREDAKKQQTFLRAVTTIVDNALPAPDSLDRAILYNANPSRIYATQEDNSLITIQSKKKKNPLIVTGDIVGVTTLDTIVHPDRDIKKPYESPDELIVAKSGLMLVIRPRWTNINLPRAENSDILVPSRALKKLPLKMV